MGPWRQVTAQNPVSGNHWDDLATACYESADYAAALAAWERAGQLGVWDRQEERPSAFPGEIPYRRSRCHARLGDGEQALAELDAAVRAGLRDLPAAAADPCWDGLRDQPRFRDLLGIGPDGTAPGTGTPGTGDRTDRGWRSDLRLLGREIRRRAARPPGPAGPGAALDAGIQAAADDLAARVPDLTDAQVATGILRLLVPLGDGHARIGVAAYPPLAPALPLEFWQYPEGLFAVAAGPAQRAALGAEVLAVDGRPVTEVLAGVEPITSRDNDAQLMKMAPAWLRRPAVLHALGLAGAPDAVTLRLRLPDGPEAEIRAAAEPEPDWPREGGLAPGWTRLADLAPGPVPACERHRDLDFWFEYQRADGLVYAQLNRVRDHPAESLPAFAGRLFDFIEAHDVQRLVLDLRWNGGGNTFLTQPLLHRLIGCGKVSRPGALFVIIGRQTFSAAQNTATAIERHTDAIFVGEPSGSRPNFTGETVPFRLPWSGLQVNVSDLFWQTSWPMDQRSWIAPDLYAPPTFAACRAGRDPAMEAIAAYRDHVPGG